jgi:hypothetical protein
MLRRRAALWMIALAVGFAILIDHDLRAGSSSTAACHWPADSSLARSGDGPTLVMFIHPHCPCTAASLEQLDLIANSTATPSVRIHLLAAEIADTNMAGMSCAHAEYLAL